MPTQRPILFHYATGGLGHFLNLLGNSLTFCSEEGWELAVVSEYHRPLANLSIDDIFQLQKPLVPLREIPKWRRLVELDRLRPMRFKDQAQGLIALITSQDKEQHFSAYLPAFELRGRFSVSTGDWSPGFNVNPEKPKPNSLLASIRHLSIRGKFRQAVMERRNLLKEPFIGVHFRNTDITNDIQETISQLVKKVEATGIRNVYWCTDDKSSIDKVVTALPDLIFLWDQPFQVSKKIYITH